MFTLNRYLKHLLEIVHHFEILAFAVFGFAMVLITMWEILKAHLSL